MPAVVFNCSELNEAWPEVAAFDEVPTRPEAAIDTLLYESLPVSTTLFQAS